MGSAGQLPKPEWLMLGVPNPRGVRLYASRDLPQANFGQAVRDYETVWQLGAQIRNMLVIDKPSYPEAIARLFEIWANQDRDKAEIGGERPALTAGRDALPGPAPKALGA
jgi:hypothetical protein